MAYKAIYRKYRPTTFDDIAGQRHIVTTLTNAIKQERLTHAYLFSGPSGNGKTSIAKLFAKAVNCTSETELICNECSNCTEANNNSHPDIIEMDAASNNGVDDIRNLIEKVKYAPLKGKYKIYIIDEVHMLSLGAFNALLKTLEEPPAHVIFILATTEPHKVIPTIMSRCQRYDFTKVKTKDIEDNIIKILNQEKITFEGEAVRLISDLAEGGVRKSLSILEQVIAYAGESITLDDVTKIYGLVTKEEKLELLECASQKDLEQALKIVNDIYDKGNNLEILMSDLINIAKELIIFNYSYNEQLLEILTPEEAEHFTELFTNDELLAMIDYLSLGSYLNEDILSFLELAMIKIINSVSDKNQEVNHVEIEVEEEIEEVSKADLDKIFADSEKTKAKVLNDYKKDDNESTKPKQNPINENVEKQIKKKEELETNEDNQEQHKETAFKEVETNKDDNNDNNIDEPKTEQPVITDDMLLSLLAHADKEKRIVMDSDWKRLAVLNDKMEYVRYEKMLSQSSILAAGDNYLVIVVNDEALVNSINTERTQEGICEFLSTIFNQRYRVISITVDKSKQLIDLFKQGIANNSLPAKIEITLPKSNDEDNSIEANANRVFNGFFETDGD